MSLVVWILLFAGLSIFSSWVLFWGGAERLEGTFASGFLIDIFAPRWSAEGIKVYTALAWLFCGIWFLVGLFVPAARFWW
jgi:hypothetical protein